jgi:hypothetical protein
MSKNKLSNESIELYNSLLDISWSEPYIVIDNIQAATGLGRSKLLPMLAELIGAGKVLHGNEEALGVILETYTPKIKGVAYGFAIDYFKNYDEYKQNKLTLEVTK